MARAGRIVLLLLLARWTFLFLVWPMREDVIGAAFLHLINLPFHEAGHVLFSPFGEFMTTLGGSLMQVLVPSGMLGRVSAVNQIFIGSSNEIGAFESGVAAKLLGTVSSVVVGGVITVAVTLVTAWRGQGGVAVGSPLRSQRLIAGRRDGVLTLHREPV